MRLMLFWSQCDVCPFQMALAFPVLGALLDLVNLGKQTITVFKNQV